MTVELRNVLAIAAASRKVGRVFLIDGEPFDAKPSYQASKSPEHAYEHTRQWIDYYQPQLLVTERIAKNSRKGQNSRALIDAIMKAAQDAEVRWAVVERHQTYANKYEEAEALCVSFPQMRNLLPKPRRRWESEPRRIIVFEALNLGLGSFHR